MWPRLSIVAGLVAGIAVAVVVLGGIVAFAPDPLPDRHARPDRRRDRCPDCVRRRGTVRGPSASASAGASGDAALFDIGEPAPPLVVPQVGGGTIDLANLRGTPVWLTSWAPTARHASTSSR